jgi:hypothetical protein
MSETPATLAGPGGPMPLGCGMTAPGRGSIVPGRRSIVPGRGSIAPDGEVTPLDPGSTSPGRGSIGPIGPDHGTTGLDG